MNRKRVHVNAYVKDDGTHVKEHYRGAPSANPEVNEEDDYNQSDNNEIKTLYGGVSRIENFEKKADFDEISESESKSKLGNIISNVGNSASKILSATAAALNIVSRIKEVKNQAFC